ncbi:MAG TPA: hypothetical protein VMS12_09235 [Thermoanaerobaculia bacterium]|nr:hypothetical protein [Thermoanaerobaculia bacterium]
MFVYAVMTGLFFSFLWRVESRERIRMFLLVACSLFLGGVLIAWLMYPFPIK